MEVEHSRGGQPLGCSSKAALILNKADFESRYSALIVDIHVSYGLGLKTESVAFVGGATGTLVLGIDLIVSNETLHESYEVMISSCLAPKRN
jgi:uncharacterized membrane protein YkvI